MPKVAVRTLKKLEGELPKNRNNLAADFKVFYGPKNSESFVRVHVDPLTRQVIGIYEIEIAEDVLKEFHSRLGYERLSRKAKEAKEQALMMPREAVQLVAAQIKYRLGWFEIKEDSLSIPAGGEEMFSEDGANWIPFPRQLRLDMYVRGFTPLDNDHRARIQALLDRGDTPWLAWRHLHRAKKESMPRDKWLEATLAIELAIKEFLIRLKPDLESFVLEMPSPPISKLYGSVLESLIGTRSSYTKEIGKGVELRNKLIHRPVEQRIDPKEAREYVDLAEAAIRELETFLGISY